MIVTSDVRSHVMHDLIYDVVIPTIGRESLQTLLASMGALDASANVPPLPGRIVVVDDRRRPVGDLPVDAGFVAGRVAVVRSGGAGPAAARNVGWRSCSAPWIVFLDDDVVLPPTWHDLLIADLMRAATDVAAVQGCVVVPLPRHRRPTDWERNVAGLQDAQWITADLAVRRRAIERVGGFDERFRRAYREDADFALRLLDVGFQLEHGTRTVAHPPRPARWSVSLGAQRGNADDALMRRLHGRHWRHRAGAPAGAFCRHLTTCTALATAAAASVVAARRSRSTVVMWARAGAAAAVVGLTASFSWRRIAPGPRTMREVAAMVATSVAIPPLAVWHRIRGERRSRHAGPSTGNQTGSPGVDAVLFDRDGTLVVDVPYNGDPQRVQLMPGAAAAVGRLRSSDIAVGMVTNQSGIARGLLRAADVDAVNARVAELIGGFDAIAVCPHSPRDGCTCRKPQPGMILDTARRLGTAPARVVVVGDIASDVEAARAAGAQAILVPNALTRRREVAAARRTGIPVFADLGAATDAILARHVRCLSDGVPSRPSPATVATAVPSSVVIGARR